MDTLEQLVHIIGLDGVKFLHSLFLMTSDREDQAHATSLLRMINKEIAILKSKMGILFKRTVTVGKTSVPEYPTTEVGSQTDMFSLLHPDGVFVNLHLGEIKQIKSSSTNLQEAALAYKQITMDTKVEETLITPKRGRRKIILRPYAVNNGVTEKQDCENGINPSETISPVSKTEIKNVDQKLNKIIVTNSKINTTVSTTDTVKAFTVSKSIDGTRTLKCGQLITIPKSKLTPISGNGFMRPNGFTSNQITRTSDLLALKTNVMTVIPSDDTLSTISSVPDPSELVKYLEENDSECEIALNLESESNVNTDVNDVKKANEEKMKRRLFVEWQLCDIMDDAGYALIHRAVLNNNVARLKLQCIARKSKKLDLDILDSLNRTPLELAILSNSSLEIFETLHSNGADFSVKQHDSGNSMVHLAVQHVRDLKVYRYIVRNTPPRVLSHVNDEGYTALHLAVRHNVAHMKVNLLLFSPSSESFINIPDKTSGKTALFYAVESNDKKLVEMFLMCRADPEVPTLSGQRLTDVIHELDVSMQLRDFILQAGKTRNTTTTALSMSNTINNTMSDIANNTSINSTSNNTQTSNMSNNSIGNITSDIMSNTGMNNSSSQTSKNICTVSICTMSNTITMSNMSNTMSKTITTNKSGTSITSVTSPRLNINGTTSNGTSILRSNSTSVAGNELQKKGGKRKNVTTLNIQGNVKKKAIRKEK